VAKPDITEALYVSGYHNPSKSWSFYYVSERSAQFWKGRKSLRVRRAYSHAAAVVGTVRRQNQTSLREFFYDNGQTWVLVMTAVLRRAGGSGLEFQQNSRSDPRDRDLTPRS
jgi:hypothetical protein